MSDRGPGRVTTRPYVTAAVVAVALALVWGVSSLGEGGEAPRPTPVSSVPSGGIPEPTFEGRLVFSAHAPDGRPGLRQRVYVYDLTRGSLDVGPRIPTARQLGALADGSVLVLSDGRRGLVDVSYAPSLGTDAELRHLPSGSIVAASWDGRQVSVLEPPRSSAVCAGDPAFQERSFRFVVGATNPQDLGVRRRCGLPVSAAALDGQLAVTLVADGHVRTVVDDVGTPPALKDLAVLSIGPDQTALLVESERPVDPSAPPTGQLLVWPFAGDPRSAVEGLVATRVLAWSPVGGTAIVNGSLGGSRAMWLIDPAPGTAQEILPTSDADLSATFSGATFDVDGNAFGASAGAIVVVTSTGTFPLTLPSHAPIPSGPIVWLP